MRGDLVETMAADVCRELAAQGASGILAIDGPDGPGRIVFREGRIIAAVSPTPRARLGDRLVGAGELDPDDLANALEAQRESGEAARLGTLLVERGLVRRDAVRVFVQEQVLDALFEIIRWRYGDYAFNPDDQDPQQGVPLSLSVDDALVEVSRRQREWDELSQIIPDLEAVPSFRTGAATASASLEPDEFAVLASVDGARSVRSLAADLGYGEFEAARIVYGLSLLGIVDVRLPQDEIGAALEDALGIGDVEEVTAAGDVEPTTAIDEPSPVSAGDEGGPGDEAPAAAQDAEDVAEDVVAALAEQERADDDLDAPAASEPETSEAMDASQEPVAEDHAPAPESADEEDEPEVWVGSHEPAAQPSEVEFEFDVDTGRDLDTPADAAASPQRPATPPSEPPPGSSIVPPVTSAPDGGLGDEDRPAASADEQDQERDNGRRSGLGRGLAAIIPGAGGWSDDRDEGDSEGVVPDDRRDDDAQEAPPPPPPSRTDNVAAGSEPQGEAAEPQGETDEPQEQPPSAEPQEQPQSADAATGQPPEQDAPSTPRPSPQRGDDNDVSEFLRELSRLSLDPPSEPGAPRPPSRPAPPPTSPPSGSSSSSSSSEGEGSSKKKRRGLFGRG